MEHGNEQVNGVRQRLDLCSGWSFVKRNMGRRWLRGAGPDKAEKVDLPHCWNEMDSFRAGIKYYRGPGSYRLNFVLPALPADAYDSSWFLVAEGFYGTADVWINGARVAFVDGQYLGFRLDVTPLLRWNESNIFGIRLTNRCARHVLPGIVDPDFLLYGGLSGRLCIERVPHLHFDDAGIQVICRNVLPASAQVDISCLVAGCGLHGRPGMVRWRIYDPEGDLVADLNASGPGPPGPDGMRDFAAVVMLKHPRLWSIENPALYHAEGLLGDGNRVSDRIIKRFGIRSALFARNHGFFLNGRHVRLRGCNRHESMPGFGNALPVNLHRLDAELIKQAGLNFVRLSHYPQNPAFLDACDELGILAYAEIATWKSARAGRWLESACRQMNDMIRRDRNHPSVILWGMGNESSCRKAYLRLRELAHGLDPSRPVAYAENHLYRARRNRVIGIPDVWGCNYELDTLDEGLSASRLGAVLVTECSNYPHALRGSRMEEARQVELILNDVPDIESRASVAGYTLWSYDDYATMRKKRYKRHCGIVDAWRIPKMSFALLQALNMEQPFLKVFGDWGAAGPPADRKVHVITNCDKVLFSVEGREIADANGSACFVQNLPYCRAVLTATGLKGGVPTAVALLEPFEEPCRLALAVRRSAGNAAGDAVVVDVSVCDSSGRVVESFDGEIEVGAGAPLRLRSGIPGRVQVSSGVGVAMLTASGPWEDAWLTACFPGIADGKLLLNRDEQAAPAGTMQGGDS